MTQIIHINKVQTMTSLEIAELTGKQHKDLLKAIRNMEPAWVKVQGRKFALLQKTYNLPNGGTKMVPYYSLTKTECLYIATKFNDDARAKLVLRWETLERLNLLIKRLNRLFVGIDGRFKTVELTVCECDFSLLALVFREDEVHIASIEVFASDEAPQMQLVICFCVGCHNFQYYGAKVHIQ